MLGHSRSLFAASSPHFCATVPIPKLGDLVDLCVEFKEVEYKDGKLHGCASISITLFLLRVGNFAMGCFTLPIKVCKLLCFAVKQLMIHSFFFMCLLHAFRNSSHQLRAFRHPC